jgi:Flp pilus assembly pilin Flp
MDLAKLLRDRRGAQLVEYLVLVGLVAVIAILGFRAFGRTVDAKAAAQAECVATFSCAAATEDGIGHSRSEQVDEQSRRDREGRDDESQKGAQRDDGGGVWGWLGNQARNFVRGGILGSFGGNTGWAGFAARLGIGFIPVVGQIADARDTIASIIHVVKTPGDPLAWTDLTASVVGWVPLFGDAAAQGIRGAPEILRAIPWIKRAYNAARQAGRGEPEPGEN